MNQEEFILYRRLFKEQLLSLLKQENWDALAVSSYRIYVENQLLTKAFNEKIKGLRKYYQQALQIGSEIYTLMYENSQYLPKEKIELVFWQLGATMIAGTLQLTGNYSFAKNMPPHAKFLHLWAKTVQAAYQNQTLTDSRIHQLRMYIDRHNLAYIRQNYKKTNISDEEALKAYALNELAGKKMIAERARFHNKYLKEQDYVTGNENRKRLTPDFHSEFILDANGCFVSQWNVLELDPFGQVITDYNYYLQKYPCLEDRIAFESQIVNGESYNYADRNDQVHKQLDSSPPKMLDYPMRKEISKKWQIPANKRQYNWKKIDNKKEIYTRKGS